MKLIITYQELQNIILRKTEKNISFQKATEGNTVKAAYKVSVDVPLLGNLSKDIDCDITFNGITGTELDISYSLPMGLDLVGKGLKTFLGKQIESTQLLKWGEKDNQIILFVDKIAEKLHVDGVEKTTKYLRITDIRALEEGLEITAELNYESL